MLSDEKSEYRQSTALLANQPEKAAELAGKGPWARLKGQEKGVACDGRRRRRPFVKAQLKSARLSRRVRVPNPRDRKF